MFAASHGMIPPVCDIIMFSPQSNKELQSAVYACLGLCPKVDCSQGPHGPIGKWDVSRVSGMSSIFRGAASFNVTSPSGT